MSGRSSSDSSMPDNTGQEERQTMAFSSDTQVVVEKEDHLRMEIENKSLRKFTSQLSREMKSAMDTLCQKDGEMEDLRIEYKEKLKSLKRSLTQSEMTITQLKEENKQLSVAVAKNIQGGRIKDHGKEGKVSVMERIISDQAIKLEDLEFTLKQALESEQTIVRSSKETLHHMEKAMNIREEQLQKCCDEKDERIAQLEEIVSQLSDEVDTMHRTRVHLEQLNMERVDPLENVKELTGVDDLDKEIGRGSYGVVKEVCVHGTTCAAKDIHKILIECGNLEVLRKKFYEECVNCSKLVHPNIVQFLGIHYPSEDVKLPWLVMEKMNCSLFQFLEKHQQKEVSLSVKFSLLLDVSHGLQYLHAHNVVHRDLSSNNILLTKFLTAKISDLGVAKFITADDKMSQTANPGTRVFMPPEAVSSSPHYGKPVDVFSLGCVMIHTLTHMYPVPADQVITDSITQEMKALSEVQRRENYFVAIPSSAVSCRPLIQKCLNNTPGTRPPVSEICTELAGSLATNCSSATEVHSMVHPELSRKIEQLESDLTAKERIIKQLKEPIASNELPHAVLKHQIGCYKEYLSRSLPHQTK
ncbi:serine/threonine-protein kinase PLK4-like isoform X2 [Dysidea avara]|uniref:serine/threonine-protein kinase PLK4-like isoform X2 n=1 Tax=Dysidea avara TaxID=196820 RepID=UPI00331A6C6F